jgi:hypothetical protein
MGGAVIFQISDTAPNFGQSVQFWAIHFLPEENGQRSIPDIKIKNPLNI